MPPDETPPIAEEEAPKEQDVPKEQDAPKEEEQDMLLTKEMFVTQIHRLTERARAAGLSPLKMMAKAYLKQGTAIFEGLLSSLENETPTKKKKE